MTRSRGCLLVGSIPFNDSETVLRRCSEVLGDRLVAIPDGETGERSNYVRFQGKLFPHLANTLLSGKEPLTQQEITALTKYFEETEMDTGYDSAALKSYEVFKKLKADGTISAMTKFQVSLPTIGSVIGIFVKPDLQNIVEPIYEKALFNSLARVQESIPHEDLAIQIDMGMDIAFWEDFHMEESFWKRLPWNRWFDKKSYVVEYISRMINQVAQDIDLGLHFCYGDSNHKHFKEPESLAATVDLYKHIRAACVRKVQWIHCPVPLSTMNALDGYYTPLAALSPILADDETKLYLGLVHANDLTGTLRRVKAAENVVHDFGVATECGMGRTPADEIEGILNLLREVSDSA